MTLRPVRHALWLIIPALGVLSTAAATPSIVPLRTAARLAAESTESRWSVPVQSSNGHLAYVLSLEPGFDVGNHLVSAELVLRRAGKHAATSNLLQPSGNWHGLQPYMFSANDLADGVKKSVFGEMRRLTLKELGLMVRVTITDAKVSPIPGDYQLDSLDLNIEVTNL